MAYTPEDGAATTWVFQDGSPAFTGRFTNNGIPAQLVESWIVERYGDPRTEHPGLPLSSFRFPVDPIKGPLPGVILTMMKTGALGVQEMTDGVRSVVQAMDIAATLCPQGEGSPLFRQFPPDDSGYSTNRENPTVVHIPNPPFGLQSYRFAGKEYWLDNVWPIPSPPPAVDSEKEILRQRLADALSERLRLAAQVTKLEGQLAMSNEALSKEITRARGVLGTKPAGTWWREMKKTVDIVAKLAGVAG